MPSFPVRIKGRDYPSGAAAARALGVHPNTVYSALERGAEDKINDAQANRVAVILQGEFFPSMRGACRALGLNERYISEALGKRSAHQKREQLAKAVRKYKESRS